MKTLMEFYEGHYSRSSLQRKCPFWMTQEELRAFYDMTSVRLSEPVIFGRRIILSDAFDPGYSGVLWRRWLYDDELN